MPSSYNLKCPYCGHETSRNGSMAVEIEGAEKFTCSNGCGMTFYVQEHDEMLVMDCRMDDQYLYQNYRDEKRRLLELARIQSVRPNMQACGNCVCYTWGENEQGQLDRHCGECAHQIPSGINFSVSKYFPRGHLHALTGGSMCRFFFAIQQSEYISDNTISSRHPR